MVEFAVFAVAEPARRGKARHVFALGPFCHTNTHTNKYSKYDTSKNHPITAPAHSLRQHLPARYTTLRSQPTTTYIIPLTFNRTKLLAACNKQTSVHVTMVFFLSKAFVSAIAVIVGALLGIKTFQQRLVEAKVR
jgi:hypothetical protein